MTKQYKISKEKAFPASKKINYNVLLLKKNQSKRLTNQHKKSKGVVGIFGDKAKLHDLTVGEISKLVIEQLEKEFPQLSFRYRKTIRKEEINEALKKIDSELG